MRRPPRPRPFGAVVGALLVLVLLVGATSLGNSRAAGPEVGSSWDHTTTGHPGIDRAPAVRSTDLLAPAPHPVVPAALAVALGVTLALLAALGATSLFRAPQRTVPALVGRGPPWVSRRR